MASVTFERACRLLKLISESNCRNTESFFVNKTTLTIFEFLTFSHFLLPLNNLLHENTLTVSQNYSEGTTIDFCVQLLSNAWKELFKKSSFTDFFKATAPYMQFGNSICQSRVHSSRFEV